MRRAQLAGIVLVQLVLLVAALVSELAVPKVAALLVAGAVIIAAVIVLLLRSLPMVLILTYYVALGFYYVVAMDPNDPLLGALIPLTAWTVILPIMLRPGIWPILVSGMLAATPAALIVVAHPTWDRAVLSASLITNLILIVNAAIFIFFLRGIAGSLDRQKKAAIEEEARVVRRRTSKEMAAEYVRVLHDTIVNTFGALAREQPQGTNTEEGQERCRRDLERIRNFQRSTAAGRQARPSLTDLDRIGLPVRWTGMSGDDLRRFQALLPVPVLDALCGCASEAVRNATKHSGADHVIVDAQYIDDELRVKISDDGCGFDRASIDERGIAESIVARGELQGLAVALDAAIGEGTTVQLSCSLSPPTEAAAPSGEVRPLGHFTRKMSIAWALHAIAIGISLEIVSPGEPSLATYLLLGALLAFAGASWSSSRFDRLLPVWQIALMLVAIPAANWCALESVGYGNDAPYLFPAVSLTVLPVLIHASGRTFSSFFLAVGVQVASMLILGMGVVDTSRYAEILLLEAPTVALLAMWFILLRKFRSIEVEIAHAQKTMDRAMREAAAHEAATEVQMQWSASGLHGSLELLQEIAAGVISPDDPETRRRCGDEETFLRQISALSQTATLMSRWFALALADARRRQIEFELHAEDAQIDDPQAADELGHLVLDCIAASPEKSAMRVTVLQRVRTVRMLIVTRRDGDLADRVDVEGRGSLRVTIERLQDHILVDATWRRSAATSPHSGWRISASPTER
ncbi:sensor histidine kinase [Microbacterium sp. MYb62]|uniref:sensor histidine kinase n=1 Tax=Microbacterium sp. MYb62 TaxID=1848690 RepID=UPI0011AFD613|nr:hypothetical protein [Microbacterium sp. MYb62]